MPALQRFLEYYLVSGRGANKRDHNSVSTLLILKKQLNSHDRYHPLQRLTREQLSVYSKARQVLSHLIFTSAYEMGTTINLLLMGNPRHRNVECRMAAKWQSQICPLDGPSSGLRSLPSRLHSLSMQNRLSSPTYLPMETARTQKAKTEIRNLKDESQQ